jgi:hypothetical protein
LGDKLGWAVSRLCPCDEIFVLLSRSQERTHGSIWPGCL